MSCVYTGQLLGIAKASRVVANECYDKGKRRDDLVASFSKIQQQLEGADRLRLQIGFGRGRKSGHSDNRWRRLLSKAS